MVGVDKVALHTLPAAVVDLEAQVRMEWERSEVKVVLEPSARFQALLLNMLAAAAGLFVTVIPVVLVTQVVVMVLQLIQTTAILLK
jgi:hypothetical protein